MHVHSSSATSSSIPDSKYAEWFHEIRKELLLSEPQNIAARALCCQNIINESITHLNMQLGLNQLDNQYYYVCNINPQLHLKFLHDWPGLRIGNNINKRPKTKREYEKKAKNWLNGRRAPNYGRTLFPFFIKESEKYVNMISTHLMSNNIEQKELYYNTLIFKVLAQLCGCSVSLNEQAKKAPFFCKNSVERKGKLKEILQSYANDHQYIHGFPSCFEEAIDYFENKSNIYFAKYRQKYIDKKPLKIMDNNNNSNNSNNSNRKRRFPPLPIIKNDTPLASLPSKKRKLNINTDETDSKYWKKQAINLAKALQIEKEQRLKAEEDCQRLKLVLTLIVRQNDNNNINSKHGNHNNNTSLVPIGTLNHLLTPNLMINNINNNNKSIPIPIQYGIIATPPASHQLQQLQQQQQQQPQTTTLTNTFIAQPPPVNTLIKKQVNTLIPVVPTIPSLSHNLYGNNNIGEQMANNLLKFLVNG